LTRVFLDANVIFAAADSSTGAARVLVRLAKQEDSGITLLATPYTFDEAERNIQRECPNALDAFYDVREHLSAGVEPSEDFAASLNARLPTGVRLPNKDLPVLGGAIVAGADWLLTHDCEHFGPLYGHTIEDVEILRPGTALRRLQQPTRGSPE
jgi:predicted nucleic acid-binding protein